MAKSIRSKRKQRVLAVRREKYRAVERKKCWEHQLRRQREKAEDMDGIIQETSETHQVASSGDSSNDADVPVSGGDVVVGEDVMETDGDKPNFSKKQLEKLSKAWRGRHDKKKRKRLAHNSKHKW